jgi:uncharacterized protein YeaO (DUF488 family)
VTIGLARVHDPEQGGGGRRFLVDRLWPRGVRRDAVRMDGWLPDVAPSHELRRWFGHDPDRWEEFQRRYAVELDEHPEAWRPLVDAVSAGDITLLYSSRDTAHNNAVALRIYLLARLGPAPSPSVSPSTTCATTTAGVGRSSHPEHRGSPPPGQRDGRAQHR